MAQKFSLAVITMRIIIIRRRSNHNMISEKFATFASFALIIKTQYCSFLIKLQWKFTVRKWKRKNAEKQRQKENNKHTFYVYIFSA